MFEVPFEYVYLISVIPLVGIWLLFFFLRKDLRKEMLFMGVFLAIAGTWAQYQWWTVDWAQFPTITGTRVGIEDILLGFAGGGVIAVAYEVLLNKHLRALRKTCNHCLGSLTPILVLGLLISFLFFFLNITSFWATTVGLLFFGFFMFWKRRDLFMNGLFTAFATTIFATTFYLFIYILNPKWIAEAYPYESLSGITFLNFPIEEFVFWFLAGFVFGPMYEYWKTRKVLSN